MKCIQLNDSNVLLILQERENGADSGLITSDFLKLFVPISVMSQC